MFDPETGCDVASREAINELIDVGTWNLGTQHGANYEAIYMKSEACCLLALNWPTALRSLPSKRERFWPL